MLEETGLCFDNFHPNSEQFFFPVSICSMALVSHIDLVLTLHALLTSKLFVFFQILCLPWEAKFDTGLLWEKVIMAKCCSERTKGMN